ncbi:hypothetical protein [Clostridium sp. 1001275B_160808_H3]|uniref:WD40/YVTN/BNR-like repeat-containing protein n=1 Tax=Clostridium sp. 1001275B_160808_H3 TaxID=2787110 RepID=UPI00189BF402|nr:hypothetical protein [Clostridium sp. 1001275B_160808_H3]
MKKYKAIIMFRTFLSMIINPIFVIVYLISLYEFYTLCRFGRVDHNITILFICMLFFLACIIYLIDMTRRRYMISSGRIIDNYIFYSDSIIILKDTEIRFDFEEIKLFKINNKYAYIEFKNREILILNMRNKTPYEIKNIRDSINNYVSTLNKSSLKTIWTYIAIIIIVITTLFYGAKIYHSATNFRGKLSWVLYDLGHKKEIKLEHNNIYEDGIEGLFNDINDKLHMPETLYLSDDFSLEFDSEGRIQSFYCFLYGKNDKDELESYLISYDSNKSKKISISLNGYVNADFNEDKLLKPLINTLKVVTLKDTVSKWNENKFGILYYGKRSFGFNKEGVVYIDKEGNTKLPYEINSEIIGYTVSVYVPGKEDIYTPVRYNLVEDLNNIKGDKLNKTENRKPVSTANSEDKEFYLSDSTGYKLRVVGAAAGSRFYSLEGTKDGGATWDIINEDPFMGRGGGASGVAFINEKLGFIALSHSGGSYGELYRTEDGGLSFEVINLPKIDVTLNDGSVISVFDFPEMPYEENGPLNVLVGQGADGDYNGNSSALYQSKDSGITWEYIEEVKKARE